MTELQFTGNPFVLRMYDKNRMRLPEAFISVLYERDIKFRQIGMYQLYIPETKSVKCYAQKDYDALLREHTASQPYAFAEFYPIDIQNRMVIHPRLRPLEEVAVSPAGQTFDLCKPENYPYQEYLIWYSSKKPYKTE